MIALLCFLLTLLVSPPFKPKSRLEAENVVLRHQLIIFRRKVRGRVHLTNGDRFFFVQLYRWFPSVLNTITIILDPTGDRLQTFCIGLRSPSNTARSGKWLAARNAQKAQISANRACSVNVCSLPAMPASGECRHLAYVG